MGMGRALAVAGAIGVLTLAGCTPGPPQPGEPPSSWPTPASTGVINPGQLTVWTGSCTFRTPGQVIENRIFNCGPDVYASGVTIRNSIVRGGQHWGINVRARTGAAVVIEDVTIQPASGCNYSTALGAGNYHATRVEIVNFGDGWRYSGNNTVVRDSYAKLCAPSGSGAHSDGMQGYLAPSATADRPIIFDHNTVDQRCVRWTGNGSEPGNGTGNPADQACSVTSNVFWADNSGDGLVVTNNLFRGGGYTIRVGSGSGHTVRDNVVERNRWAYGPTSSSCAVIAWTGNRLADVTEGGIASNYEPLPCG